MGRRIKQYVSGEKILSYLDRLHDNLRDGSYLQSRVKNVDARLRFLCDYIAPAVEDTSNGLGTRLKKIKGALKDARHDWPTSQAKETVEAIDEIFYGPVGRSENDDIKVAAVFVGLGAEFFAAPYGAELLSGKPVPDGAETLCYTAGGIVLAGALGYMAAYRERTAEVFGPKVAEVSQFMWDAMPFLR